MVEPNYFVWINMISGVATAVGVVFAAAGLLFSWRQSISQFEDEMTTEYRTLIKEMPVGVLLDRDQVPAVNDELLSKIYNYIDFTNEQVFLRQKGRIRSATWRLWVDGIESNLSKPAIREGWAEIKARSSSFSELRTLEELRFDCDPHSSDF